MTSFSSHITIELNAVREGSINRVHGNIIGLKASQIKRIERLYRKRIPPQRIISPDVARLLAELSSEVRRQIGILVGRRGTIEDVLVGDQRSVTLPDLSRFRTGVPRLRGLRFIHTHLQREPLTQEDLTDLALLRLDMIVAVNALEDGMPGDVYTAHLLPDNPEKKILETGPPLSLAALDLDFLGWVQALEDEFQRGQRAIALKGPQERAILISVSRESRERIESSLEELTELAESSGVVVADVVVQRPQHLSTTTLVGEGKLRDLVIKCMQLGVDLIIFDQNLTPGQMASISDRTELRVIDRTQLILDLFAQRAHTQDGKIQVELAQLKYLLPRLAKKTLALSRLTGGIGGRGPGETKLEVDRRRVRERIHLQEKELQRLARRREQRGARRERSGIPIVSIVGYTNAGKTTLFNLLTRSHFQVEEKLFATLDPATRRLRFPRCREMVITDTVGFIRDLPEDLLGAFRATFDGLRESDLLIHLVDISNPSFPEHIEEAQKILHDLDLGHIPRLLVFNKVDRQDPGVARAICQKHDAVCISALRPESLDPLFHALQRRLWEERDSRAGIGKLTNMDSFDISSKYFSMGARSGDGNPS